MKYLIITINFLLAVKYNNTSPLNFNNQNATGCFRLSFAIYKSITLIAKLEASVLTIMGFSGLKCRKISIFVKVCLSCWKDARFSLPNYTLLGFLPFFIPFNILYNGLAISEKPYIKRRKKLQNLINTWIS